MEPDVRNFLSKILSSISTTLLWMLINSTVGIGFNYAFFEGSPSLSNYIFYVWFVVSFVFLLGYLLKKWSKSCWRFGANVERHLTLKLYWPILTREQSCWRR